MFSKKKKPLATNKTTGRTFDDSFPVTIPALPASDGTESKQHRDKGKSKAVDDAVLLWMSGLSESIRPVELVACYPRIALDIMQRWSDAHAVNTYLNGLILSERGDRQGFPKTVLTELLRLQGAVFDRRNQPPPPTWSAHER